jgi:hypothetical protein
VRAFQQRQRIHRAAVLSDELPYDAAAFGASLRSAVTQDHPHCELLIADSRGSGAPPDFLPADLPAERVRHVPGDFANRAAAFNAAIKVATGDHVLLVCNDGGQVVLKQSAVRTMLMAALRDNVLRMDEHRPVGLVYSDYERVAADGSASDVHLLDWHPGRLRDTTDLGQAWLVTRAALDQIGGLDASRNAGEWYDLRLKVSEHFAIAHIANRYAGSALHRSPRRARMRTTSSRTCSADKQLAA